MFSWPFNSAGPRHQWTMIEAAGFSSPVPGCIYTGHRLDGGVPLGGLGTGYFTLEGSGKIGSCSIFNDIVPPRRDFKEWLTVGLSEHEGLPLSTADIAYWGHFPVADMVCRFAKHNLELGIRAFSSIIPGDLKNSNIPAALFEIEIRNDGTAPIDVDLVIKPPQVPDKQIEKIALLGENIDVSTNDGQLVGRIRRRVEAQQAHRVRFVFAWYAPHWRDSGKEAHVHQYSVHYPDARAVAADALERFDYLLKRILAWQEAIYTTDLPAWLRDGLIQSLYSLAKNTIWIAQTRKDEWWNSTGWFTHSESHSGCPITETMVCRMHGHFPALFFYPELEATTLEAFRHFQILDGEIPFSYGMGTSMRDPRYHCQHPLNSGQYAQMVYRLFLRTGDRAQLAHFYESARRAIRYQYSLDDDQDGLVNEQAHVKPGELWPANQFYDIWPWAGTSAYVAGTWLATLACGEALAEEMKDTEFRDECRQWQIRGKAAYQAKLWTGQYYRLWYDPENTSGEGTHNDVSLGNQLMGQWCVKIAGLSDVLPVDQITTALNSIEQLNMAATAHGLVNGVTPDGHRYFSKANAHADQHVGIDTDNDHAMHVFVGENLCAAMTFIYHDRRDTGLEISKRIYEAIALTTCSPWNQRCIISAETRLPIWGDDYYSNMAIWALPMALNKQSVSEFATGEFLHRILNAVD
jgi:uncharacterized protein (DUF608 family)